MEIHSNSPKLYYGFKPCRTHRFDVSVQEANLMDALYRLQNLGAEPQHGADRERAAGLGAAQLGQILSLDRHHDVVELVVATAADELADVVASWNNRWYLHRVVSTWNPFIMYVFTLFSGNRLVY